MSEHVILICAPAGDPVTVKGASFDRSCSRCNGRVMIAPSGQAVLRAHADAEIVCVVCYLRNPPTDAKIRASAGTTEDVLREAADYIPNPWRKRN